MLNLSFRPQRGRTPRANQFSGNFVTTALNENQNLNQNALNTRINLWFNRSNFCLYFVLYCKKIELIDPGSHPYAKSMEQSQNGNGCISSTTKGILAITKIDNKAVGSGYPGEKILLLAALLEDLLRQHKKSNTPLIDWSNI